MAATRSSYDYTGRAVTPVFKLSFGGDGSAYYAVPETASINAVYSLCRDEEGRIRLTADEIKANGYDISVKLTDNYCVGSGATAEVRLIPVADAYAYAGSLKVKFRIVKPDRTK